MVFKQSASTTQPPKQGNPAQQWVTIHTCNADPGLILPPPAGVPFVEEAPAPPPAPPPAPAPATPAAAAAVAAASASFFFLASSLALRRAAAAAFLPPFLDLPPMVRVIYISTYLSAECQSSGDRLPFGWLVDVMAIHFHNCSHSLIVCTTCLDALCVRMCITVATPAPFAHTPLTLLPPLHRLQWRTKCIRSLSAWCQSWRTFRSIPYSLL